MADAYMETKKDLDRLKKLFRQLRLKKEQEISLFRIGKRLPASTIREMREMEATISALLERRRVTSNAQQRVMMEGFKSQFQSSMRGWKNRLAFAEQARARRARRKAAAAGGGETL